MKRLLPFFVLAALLAGCSSVRQNAQSVVYDPKTGITTTNAISASIITTGNAKAAVESMKGSVGKTISIGTAGVSQETDLAEIIRSAGEALSRVFEAGVKAGAAKTVVPVPTP